MNSGYSGFFVEVMQGCFLSTIESSFKAEYGKDLVNLVESPTYVILDLGCTRAMGSRAAMTRLLAVALEYGITHETLVSDSKFNFANSQTATCKERCRLWFPTEPPMHTDFDIIEEGNVPLLLSLPQMKNLRMTIELSPEATNITSPAFGNRRVLIKSSTSNHIVLDLCTLEALPLNLPRIIQNLDFNPNYPSFMTSPELVTAQADSRGE